MTSGRVRAACCSSPTTWRSVLAPSTPPPPCARSAPRRGAPPTSSPPAGRPTGAMARTPTGLQHYYQYQVILKPSPPDSQALYLESLGALGIDPLSHDIRFVEDDWESPTLGAWGLGWEVWCDGMEVTQFTYFQQVGGIDCDPVSGRVHLWPRAPRHVRAGGRERLRPRLERGRGGGPLVACRDQRPVAARIIASAPYHEIAPRRSSGSVAGQPDRASSAWKDIRSPYSRMPPLACSPVRKTCCQRPCVSGGSGARMSSLA